MAAEYILKEGNEVGDPVRARDPHVRDRLPVHARPDGGAGAQGADPSAGDRRPQPRGGSPGARAAAVAGGRGSRRRRDHRRGPSETRGGDLRRAAERWSPTSSPATSSGCRLRPRWRARLCRPSRSVPALWCEVAVARSDAAATRSATSGSSGSSRWSRRRQLLDELPLSRRARRGRCCAAAPRSTRSSTASDDRLLVVVGPCSVHDVEATLEYAARLSSEASGCAQICASRCASTSRSRARRPAGRG